ncbi:hypothetical protein [Allobranchiibius sp. GilTou73]|uniref:hypothetical protein n=1 Tax=Allobranchiibius sp. GilTou73 TaxID=2904523 RepID=UPI001F28FA7D|nr:hypothetical protein [Allobranchiibius sp. GilTou73]UIJ33403.1 hypothetical protein LVQ62_09405 [Allobranchiibius sp. GilTou73]
MRRGAGAAAMAAAMSVTLAACSVSFHVGGTGSGTARATVPPSIVHDGRVSLDFRQTPTRAAFGLPADQSWRGYEARYKHTYDLSITLPGGVLRLPAHSIDGDTDDAGGAVDTDHGHRPKYFTVDVLYPSEDAADTALAQQSALLGISHRPSASDALVDGSPSRDLFVEVQRQSNLSATLSAPGERYYYFSFDRYDNAAVAAVLHDGRMDLDARTRPSRAQLGFLDDYARADIQTSPPSKAPVALTLRTPHGTVTLAVDSLTSTSGRDADPQLVRQRAAPSRTSTTWVGTVAEARAQLVRAAPALGLAPSAISALFAGPADTAHTVRTTTSAYDLEVSVQADPSEPGPYAASIGYRFTWRDPAG